MIEAFGVQWGTVFQLLTTLFSGGILGILATFYIRNRKISVDAAETLRLHYADELQRVVERQHECEDREEALRKRVRALEDNVEGLYRTIIATSAEKVIEMGETVPEHIRDLAHRTLAAQRTHQ